MIKPGKLRIKTVEKEEDLVPIANDKKGRKFYYIPYILSEHIDLKKLNRFPFLN